MIDIAGRRVVKYHVMHSHWRYSLPAAFGASLSPEASVQWLFWDERFECAERVIHGLDDQRAELAAFVDTVRPYPRWRLAAAATASGAARVARATGRRLRAGRGLRAGRREAG